MIVHVILNMNNMCVYYNICVIQGRKDNYKFSSWVLHNKEEEDPPPPPSVASLPRSDGTSYKIQITSFKNN